MGNYTSLKSSISSSIRTNGNNAITGAILQNVLNTMVNSLGAKYQFVGVATTDMNPGTPDYNVAYLAGPGTYANFGGATIAAGKLGVLKYNGSWTVETIDLPSGGDSFLEQSGSAVQVKSAYTDLLAPNGVVVGKSEATVYVGPGETFTTLGDALTYLSKFSRFFKNGGLTVKILLRSTFVFNEEIVISGVDLSWITIEKDGFVTPSLDSANMRSAINGTLTVAEIPCLTTTCLFDIKNGAKSPQINVFFVNDDTNVQNYVFPTLMRIENGSTGYFGRFAGGRYMCGITARYESHLFAEGLYLYNDYDGISIIGASSASIEFLMLNDIYEQDPSSAAIRALRASCINMENAYIDQMTEDFFIAADGSSRVDAYGIVPVNDRGTDNIRVDSDFGANIFVSHTGSNAALTIGVSRGGIVSATGLNINGNISFNTIQSSGIIFKN